MSLNRCEQRIIEYVQAHKEERQYWELKVRAAAKSYPDDYGASLALDADLWAYYVERSQVVEPFMSAAQREGLRRTSLRNLAEYWLRLWTNPRAKKVSRPGPESVS
ncbi:hypothetical protein GALL_10380 [mine drainage metagenome]|uniref:Uncharacterized protein n=1 Tax=mine drainage metagenome TaxID=410659 RepID=A0A1J5TCP9_9ZZZZ